MMFSCSIAPVGVVAATSAEQTFTVPGLQVGDYINGGAAAAQTAGLLTGSMRVTAVNTLAIQFVNVTAGSVTPVAGTYGFVWGRAEQPNNATNVV
jgi:hypothetical protein